MVNFNIWIILGISSLILLIVYWRSRNAVWGGLTIGIILGLIIAIIYFFRGHVFSWYIIGKGAIIGTIVGFGAELLGKLSDFIKRRKK
jgi:cell shape-determining protein MreD